MTTELLNPQVLSFPILISNTTRFTQEVIGLPETLPFFVPTLPAQSVPEALPLTPTLLDITNNEDNDASRRYKKEQDKRGQRFRDRDRSKDGKSVTHKKNKPSR
jgi:hypothetical protein